MARRIPFEDLFGNGTDSCPRIESIARPIIEHDDGLGRLFDGHSDETVARRRMRWYPTSYLFLDGYYMNYPGCFL